MVFLIFFHHCLKFRSECFLGGDVYAERNKKRQNRFPQNVPIVGKIKRQFLTKEKNNTWKSNFPCVSYFSPLYPPRRQQFLKNNCPLNQQTRRNYLQWLNAIAIHVPTGLHVIYSLPI